MFDGLSDEVRALCRAQDIHIDPAVLVDFRQRPTFAIESPAQIDAGTIDLELMGAFSYLGGGVSWSAHIDLIGRFTSIARNVVIGMAEHPTDFISTHPLFYGAQDWQVVNRFRDENRPMVDKALDRFERTRQADFGKVSIGNDVWIGEGAFIRRGVQIGDGAIVGARSVVLDDVPPYAIVVGAPARVVRYRFEPAVVEQLMQLQWWLYGLSALAGADFTLIDMALWRISENIQSGRAEPYRAPVLEISATNVTVHSFP